MEVTTVTSVTPTIFKNLLDSRNFVVINWCHRSSAYRRQVQSESEADMSESEAIAAVPAIAAVVAEVKTKRPRKPAEVAAAPKNQTPKAEKPAPDRFKIGVAALPFSEVRMTLPKSFKATAFDKGGGQISIVRGLLRLGDTECWLPFGVALRWQGNNTAVLTPAVQLPKLASGRTESAIKTDSVAAGAALETFERDLSAAAVAFYKSEIKRQASGSGAGPVAMSAGVQTFSAADLGLTIDTGSSN